MKPSSRDAQRWLLGGACTILIHLSGCALDTTTLPGLEVEVEDDCPDASAPPPCDAGDACPPAPSCVGKRPAPAGYNPPPCAEGQKRSCKIILAEHNGITDCMLGVQRCEAGVWSEECTLDEGAPAL